MNVEKMMQKQREIIEDLIKQTDEAYKQRKEDELKITADMKQLKYLRGIYQKVLQKMIPKKDIPNND